MRFFLVGLLAASSAQACLHDCVPDDRLYRITRHYEGLRLYPYKDIAGHVTDGFGHLVKPGETLPVPLTGEQAEALLEQDESESIKEVNRVVGVDLGNNKFSALVDFAFNLGIGAFERSTLFRVINRNKIDEAPAEFLKYDKARIGGILETIEGLLSRRQAEVTLFEAEK